LVVTADNKSKLYGDPNPPLTASYSGFKNSETLASSGVTGSPSLTTAATQTSPVGPYTINVGPGTLAAANYGFSFVNGTLSVIYRWDGFLQPINDTAHQIGATTSVFKAGSTVPVKFQLKKGDGTVVQSAQPIVFYTPVKGVKTSESVDESVYSDPPDSGSTYRWDGNQYIYNWKTSSNMGGYYYRLTVKFEDGTSYYVDIGLR
jgi:hypothetical protein